MLALCVFNLQTRRPAASRQSSMALRSLQIQLRKRKHCHAKLNCTPSPQGKQLQPALFFTD